MKIGIASTGPDLNSLVDSLFARCQYFLVLDEKGKTIKSIPNQASQATRGAGVAAAQIIANEGVSAVIAGNIGPNAFMILNQTGIKVYLGVPGLSCKEAFEKFNQGKLTQLKYPVPSRAPRGRFGRGRGLGLGRRQRRGQR